LNDADAQVTFISLLLSALFGWIAFAVDIALAIIARNRLRRAYDIGGSLGNGIWLALGGAVRIYSAELFSGMEMKDGTVI
jgi:hypothetical protein